MDADDIDRYSSDDGDSDGDYPESEYLDMPQGQPTISRNSFSGCNIPVVMCGYMVILLIKITPNNRYRGGRTSEHAFGACKIDSI